MLVQSELTNTEAIELLKAGEYGVLSSVSENGYAYGVPLNYVYFDNSIYFHCAAEGRKLDDIKKNDKVRTPPTSHLSMQPGGIW
ncbi:MAG: hypothetical protein GX808_08820 [Syntrophomonadaceae bacterium]|jgi:nitroimidazol reductase NimA-like FMN-containing flavoprotein (pyridoxamine 5'-phosphate oxidase superfamily)|nr:hypothetical protein [Syntrophomonadaceae bacterium]